MRRSTEPQRRRRSTPWRRMRQNGHAPFVQRRMGQFDGQRRVTRQIDVALLQCSTVNGGCSVQKLRMAEPYNPHPRHGMAASSAMHERGKNTPGKSATAEPPGLAAACLCAVCGVRCAVCGVRCAVCCGCDVSGHTDPCEEGPTALKHRKYSGDQPTCTYGSRRQCAEGCRDGDD